MNNLTVGRIEQLTTKPDQAQGLRELVKGGAFEQVGLPAVFDRKPEVDYKKLWNDYKAELSAEADKCVGNQNDGYSPTLDAIKARADLDRMEQAETFARIRQTSP